MKRTRFTTATALTCLTVLTFANRATADIIHVPADKPTIQIAIQVAQPFDTIIVAPDTYFEAISFDGPLFAFDA